MGEDTTEPAKARSEISQIRVLYHFCLKNGQGRRLHVVLVVLPCMPVKGEPTEGPVLSRAYLMALRE